MQYFGLSTWATKNQKTVILLAFLFFLLGVGAYTGLPKESFPEITLYDIYVSTAYPGNGPDIIEDKITKPFEKEINTIKGVKKVTSSSVQGFSSIKVEFNGQQPLQECLQKVKDAVDKAKAKKEFPQDLPVPPQVIEADVSQMPIININLSGDYTMDQLDDFAKLLKDEIEVFPEINKVDIRGIQKKELLIELDPIAAEARDVSFNDVQTAITAEHINISAGEILDNQIRRTININGELLEAKDFEAIVVKENQGHPIFLKDIAKVSFIWADPSSYARQFGLPVVTLDVKKRSGENLIDATEKIKQRLRTLWQNKILPADLKYTLTNDQSKGIKNQVDNLENSIILSVILVVGVLLFFLGLRNALFVGIAIPLSMLMSFMIIQMMGYTINTMLLFSMVLALGMLVDNGIVVIENIYRLIDEGEKTLDAVQKGISEVAWPIISSTATTLAAFVPLIMWPGVMGEFMKYIPITLIIVLSSSLFVALVINPALAIYFMQPQTKKTTPKTIYKQMGIWIGIGILFLILGKMILGNTLIFIGLFVGANYFYLEKKAAQFQTDFLPILENKYKQLLQFALKNKNPRRFFLGTVGLLFFSFFLFAIFPPQVEFFPINQPMTIQVFIEKPIGTDIEQTNQTTLEVEQIINKTLEKYLPLYTVHPVTKDTILVIESIIAQVGQGGGSDQNDSSETPNKAKVLIGFPEYEFRHGLSTSEIMIEIKEALEGKFTSDVSIVVDKNRNGPPQEPPINIEIKGNFSYPEIINEAEKMRQYIIKQNIDGIEELKLDIELNKPELPIVIDREKARTLGLRSDQIAMQIRTAVFGNPFGTYKQDKDVYDIKLRYQSEDRNSLDMVLNQKIIFRDQLSGKLKAIPLSAVIEKPQKTSTFSAVKRLNQIRLVRIKSAVSEGFNANKVVKQIEQSLKTYQIGMGYQYKFTGQQEEQAAQMSFLSRALLIAVFLIFLIIVTQFNSISSPLIIMISVVLSLIGVFLGLVLFQRPFIILMTMIGIISLAGVVVNNAIVLIDYTNLLVNRKKENLGLEESAYLEEKEMIECIVESGKTRLRPVLLTALTTILGLIPMAIGLNIDFLGLLQRYDPNLYFGGDNALFFGPMSEAIVYGLVFATFLTLVIVPVMYFLLYKAKKRFY